MFGRIQSGARLLGRVHGSAVSRQCQQALCELRSPLQQQQWLASSLHRGASSAARPLAGKNIFQLRAAAEAVETAAADEQQHQQQQQQGPKQQQKQQKQKGKQPKQPHAQHQAQQEPPKMVPLPTSDESEQLLKIRHSVSLVGLLSQ